MSYDVQTATDLDNDGPGETEVEGYGAGGQWLGTVTVSGVGTRDVSAAFANEPLIAVRVRPSERIRISSLSFKAVRKTRPPQTQIVEQRMHPGTPREIGEASLVSGAGEADPGKRPRSTSVFSRAWR